MGCIRVEEREYREKKEKVERKMINVICDMMKKCSERQRKKGVKVSCKRIKYMMIKTSFLPTKQIDVLIWPRVSYN